MAKRKNHKCRVKNKNQTKELIKLNLKKLKNKINESNRQKHHRGMNRVLFMDYIVSKLIAMEIIINV